MGYRHFEKPACLLWEQGVGGSNPLAPTIKIDKTIS